MLFVFAVFLIGVLFVTEGGSIESENDEFLLPDSFRHFYYWKNPRWYPRYYNNYPTPSSTVQDAPDPTPQFEGAPAFEVTVNV